VDISKIPPAEFVKSRLLGAAAEAKFVREHKIYPFGRGTQNCRRYIVGTLLFRLLFVKIGLGVYFYVNTREFYNGISNFINTTLT
jgi:hypothetical protein